jgi:hypothetical protein
VITIIGIGDHLWPEWLITITGMRRSRRGRLKMPNITQIDVRIFTVPSGTESETGTENPVYLGLGGREFRLSSPANPKLKLPDFTFHFGTGHNVDNPALNDPTKPTLITESVKRWQAIIASATAASSRPIARQASPQGS